MGLLINGNFLSRKVTGVERFAHEISKELLKKKDVRIVCRASSSLNGSYPVKSIKDVTKTSFSDIKAWSQLVLPCYIKKGEILWTPDNIGPLISSNQILTLHDMAVKDNPEAYSRRIKLIYDNLLPILVKRVAKIITVSNFSKNRILHYFKIPEEKVHVVHNAVSSEFTTSDLASISSVVAKYNLPKKYVLSLSTIEKRKNLERLIEAWMLLPDDIKEEFDLVLAGGRVPSFKHISFSEIKGIHFIGYVADIELPALYGGASLFVYPSFYEGFGIPPLEALNCGTPVVTSRGTAMEEVLGESAQYFDPYSVQEIRNAILLELNSKRKVSFIPEFTWDKSANQIYDIYQSL